MVKCKNERNYGIDLLRIFSMFMVVILHVLGAGGILEATGGMVFHNRAAWLLEIVAYCAVNCYALISGYVGVNGKFKFTNIIVLWFQVFFYNFLINGLFWIFKFQPFTLETIKNTFFPVFTRQYWYFTAYFCTFLFIPILNLVLNRMSKKQMGIILGIGMVNFSVFPTLFEFDMFNFVGGYSPWWLIFLYLVGGYIKKYNLFSTGSWKEYFACYFCFALFTFLSKIGFEFITIRVLGDIKHNLMFVNYTSPTIVGCAVCLLIAFSKMNLKKLSKIIAFFTPLSFSVYLIHTNPLVFGGVWSNYFLFLIKYSPLVMVLGVLGCAMIVYLCCSMIDFIRLKIFKLCKLKEKVSKLEQLYLNDLF